jgi:hypothetical protein
MKNWSNLPWSTATLCVLCLVIAFCIGYLVVDAWLQGRRRRTARWRRRRIFVINRELNQHRITVTLPSSALRDFKERP